MTSKPIALHMLTCVGDVDVGVSVWDEHHDVGHSSSVALTRAEHVILTHAQRIGNVGATSYVTILGKNICYRETSLPRESF